MGSDGKSNWCGKLSCGSRYMLEAPNQKQAKSGTAPSLYAGCSRHTYLVHSWQHQQHGDTGQPSVPWHGAIADSKAAGLLSFSYVAHVQCATTAVRVRALVRYHRYKLAQKLWLRDGLRQNMVQLTLACSNGSSSVNSFTIWLAWRGSRAETSTSILAEPAR